MQDEDDPETTEAPSEPSVMKWVIPGGLAIFLAVLGAQVSAPIVTTLILGDPNASPEEEIDDAAEAEAAAQEMVAAEDAYVEQDPAIYTPLDPPLLASFTGDEGPTRYLQLSVQAMGRKQSSMDAVRTHAPALRNAFLFLISNRSYRDIVTIEGKEQLRAEMLTEAQAIMRRNTGEPAIEQIYFTSFVVQ